MKHTVGTVAGIAGLIATAAAACVGVGVVSSAAAAPRYIVRTHGADLTVRDGGGATGTNQVGHLTNNSVVRILCQQHGQLVSDGFYSPTDLWDQIGPGRYVSDAYIQTGHRGMVAPQCAQGTGEQVLNAKELARQDHELLAASSGSTYEELDRWWKSAGPTRHQNAYWVRIYAHKLKDVAQATALRAADIDAATWDPQKGLNANNDAVQKVYEYYQHLFEGHRELQWAGLAKLAGAPVYGGMRDAALGPWWFPDADYMEVQLLAMQKAIFDDLAWQHQLYVDRGLNGLRAVHDGAPELFPDAGARNADRTGNDVDLFRAWEGIASGDPARITRGNQVIVAREQDPVLQPFYDQIRGFALFALPGFLSDHAKSPVPDDVGFYGVPGRPNCPSFPKKALTPWFRCSYSGAGSMDVTKWEDREVWIYEHMFPKFQDLLQQRPDFLLTTIQTPLSDRTNAEFRFRP